MTIEPLDDKDEFQEILTRVYCQGPRGKKKHCKAWTTVHWADEEKDLEKMLKEWRCRLHD